MRGKQARKRTILPDAKYGNAKISKFVNYMMIDGKKSVALGLMYKALESLSAQLKGDPVELFEKALLIIKPPVEIKAKRVGGANYQVPVPVAEGRQEALAMKWIINAARAARGSKDFANALKEEFVNALNKTGEAFKKREETVRMAEANKAFAHFAG